MILTITLNPSMDHNYIADTFQLGKMTRFANPHISIGGKGINAGRVAALSESEVVLTGFLGGNNGRQIFDTLANEKLYHLEFLAVEGVSRNAITIMHDDDTHTEIVESGPEITPHDEHELYDHLEKLLQKYPIDVICISGSVNSADPFFYSNLLDYLRELTSVDFPILMDVSGVQLTNLLQNKQNRPTMIKPNTHELEEILQQEFKTKADVHQALENPLFEKIDYAIISCGGDGAVIKLPNRVVDVTIPAIEITNTTGCGDATVGGAAYAISQGYSTEDTIKYAMACGMSNATFKTNGQIDRYQVKKFANAISIREAQFV